MNKKIRTGIIFIACFIWLLGARYIAAGFGVCAAENINAPLGSLSLHYEYQSVSLDGVKVRIYKVAEMNPDGTCSLIAPYNDPKSFPITYKTKITEASQWNDLVTPVSAYIYTNGVAPSAVQTTVNGGKVFFEHLPLGIYLVVADPLSVPSESCIYSFSSFFISIPAPDENGVFQVNTKDVVGVPKCEKTTGPTTYNYAVYKRWNDFGYESLRPASITIHVYRDGQLYTTQTLNAGNNWSYSWSYEQGHNWAVSEELNFSGYSMTTEQSGNIIYLYNTHTTREEEEVLGESRDKPEVLGDSRLPQTGQLWWPVPLLILTGQFLMIRGWRMKRSEND